jgi:hypothetical protein
LQTLKEKILSRDIERERYCKYSSPLFAGFPNKSNAKTTPGEG